MKKIIVLMLVFVCGAVSAGEIVNRSLFGQDAIKILDEGKIIYSEKRKITPAFLEGATKDITYWDVIYEKNMWFCVKDEIPTKDVSSLRCLETLYIK